VNLKISVSILIYCLACCLRDTPTPHILRLEDEEENEGGEKDDESSHTASFTTKRKKRSRRSHRKPSKQINGGINHSENTLEIENSMDVQSIDVRTERNQNKSSSSSSITEKVKEKLRKFAIFNDIPLSAFESSSSSSSDTFESVNQEDLLKDLEQNRNQVIEEISSNQEEDKEEEKE
jgi:hypothetical protein